MNEYNFDFNKHGRYIPYKKRKNKIVEDKRLSEIKKLREMGKTLKECGESFNISKQRIEKIIAKTNNRQAYKRYFTEKTCIYDGLRRWLNTNCANLKDFVIRFKGTYYPSTSERISKKLKGNVAFNFSEILEILSLTNMTFEELFLSENKDIKKGD